jgi:hypothetical protein
MLRYEKFHARLLIERYFCNFISLSNCRQEKILRISFFVKIKFPCYIVMLESSFVFIEALHKKAREKEREESVSIEK